MKKSVSVIGAGTMGIGVSICLIVHSYDVVLIDCKKEKIEYAQNTIENIIRYYPIVEKMQKKQQSEKMLGNIKYALDVEMIGETEIIIENITEDIALKSELYKSINKYIAETTILCSNTSCIPISCLAKPVDKPERVVGTHFMNPAYMHDTVEVVKTSMVSEDVLKSVLSFLEDLGKKTFVVNDSAGFVTNRVSHLFMNEAAHLVYEGIAPPKLVDDIFKSCYGHKMGPLETADLIGIDTVVNSLNVLKCFYNDPRFACCRLLEDMVDKGKLGRKSGQGFYKYV